MATKGYILNGAFVFLKISGLVSKPSPEDIADCLPILDNKLAELSETFDLGYIQPSEPGESRQNDNSGLQAKFIGPIQKIIAMELLPVFGKRATIELMKIADQGLKVIEHICVCVGPAQLPDTLPRGKANESYHFTKYFGVDDKSEKICSSETIAISDTYDYTISWSDWLSEGATVTGYTIKASDGLSLDTHQLQVNDVYFKVTGKTSGPQAVDIQITSSEQGRVDNRTIYFNVVERKA